MNFSNKFCQFKKNFRKIPSLRETGLNYVKYSFIQPFSKRPFLPKTIAIFVTYRCNARCIMCKIWETNPLDANKSEVSLKDLDCILSDPLFSKIEHVNINGGEPTLREDLFNIVEIIIKKIPHLKQITMSSNGLITERVASIAKDISDVCRKNKIKHSLSISMHGVGDVLEKVYGVKEAFNKIEKTLKMVKSIQEKNNNSLSINCVLTDVNLLDVYELLNWSKQEGLNINFALGEVRERFLNLDTNSKTLIGKEKRDFLIKFLRELARDKGLFNPSAFRYYNLANMIEFNEQRTISCHYAMGGVVLGPYGDLYYCPHSKAIGDCRNSSAYDIYYSKSNLEYRKNELINRGCRKCPPYTFNEIEFQKDILKYLGFVVFRDSNRYNSLL